MDFVRVLNIAQILVSIALVTVVLFQARGRGLGSGLGGSTLTHTRRGVEKTIFQLTIALAVLFILVSAISVRIA
ncbi:MAG: preprotein translocase subunit SecG [Dehalococcoidia bacterium]